MGYDPALHEVLRDNEARHPWFRARAGLVAHLIRKHAGHSPSVLDGGCGTAWTTSRIAGTVGPSIMVGTDVSTSEAASAGHPGVLLVRSDIFASPFRRGFDVILLLDVLEHFEDDRAALRSASSALAPGGLVVVTVPAMPSLWSGYDVACGHSRRYTRHSLLALLKECGYETLFCSHFVVLPAPLVLLRRRIAGKASDAIESAGFDLGRLSSVLLWFYLSAELLLLRSGFRFTSGSSLVAVARLCGA